MVWRPHKRACASLDGVELGIFKRLLAGSVLPLHPHPASRKLPIHRTFQGLARSITFLTTTKSPKFLNKKERAEAPALSSATCFASRDVGSNIKDLKSGPLDRRSCFEIKKKKKHHYHPKEKEYDYDGYYEKEGYYGEKGQYGEKGHYGGGHGGYNRRYARSANPNGYGQDSSKDIYYKGDYHYDGKAEYYGESHSGYDNGVTVMAEAMEAAVALVMHFEGSYKYKGAGYYDGEFHSSEGNDGYKA
ncbi:hypothetical protein VP01_1759g3 [Puccinia sorghi]|uniref:Uncharacterized protein n=1 Tax=Puccinia sorghi TaxID=27349 RepID=A0A0L6VF14_9BASI|nr:hypothetical protein VP01_1759g3 [Puccinia sorghi]